MKKLYIFALMMAFLFSSVVADEEDPPPRGKAATINIITEPPNSDVFLGGEQLGKSPIKDMQVKSGRQTLVVIDQGFELVNKRVNIWPGNDSRNNFDFSTKIPKGHVKVTTTPTQCLIFVDGEQSDKTDGAELVIHNLDAGDHVISAQCSNRRSAEALVNVKGEETTDVHLDATNGAKVKGMKIKRKKR